MKSSLELFFDGVRTTYDAALVQAGVDEGLVAQVRGDWFFGPRHVSHERPNLARPKVVLVCPDDTFGPLTAGAVRTTTAPAREVRAVYNRRSPLLWHVWGPDRGTVEEVVSNLVVAQLRSLPPGSGSRETYSPVSTRWIHDEQPDERSAGSYAILQTEIVHRITDQITTRQALAVAAITHTGSLGNETVC